MIELSTSLLRQIRSLFQRVVGRATRVQGGPVVVFDAQTDQLTIRASGAEAAIEYRLSGSFEPTPFVIPLATLAEWEGRSLQWSDSSRMATIDFGCRGVMAPYLERRRSGLPNYPARLFRRRRRVCSRRDQTCLRLCTLQPRRPIASRAAMR